MNQDAAKVTPLRTRKAKARRAAVLRAQFGELSAREIELVAQAEDFGYRRGYARAYAPIRKGAA
jgi:cell division protein FtsB